MGPSRTQVAVLAGTMSPSPVVPNLLCAASRAVRRLLGKRRGLQHAAAPVWPQPKHQFQPEKVAVVTKTTRYEFEQQRYRYAGLSEEDLKQLVGLKRHLLAGACLALG